MACGDDSGPDYTKYAFLMVGAFIALAALTLPYCILLLHDLISRKLALIYGAISGVILVSSIFALGEVHGSMEVISIMLIMCASVGIPYFFLVVKAFGAQTRNI